MCVGCSERSQRAACDDVPGVDLRPAPERLPHLLRGRLPETPHGQRATFFERTARAHSGECMYVCMYVRMYLRIL